MATTNKKLPIKNIPDTDNVLRYCSPINVDDDERIAAAAFELRPGEYSLSVYWMEYFGSHIAPKKQIEKVRVDAKARLNIKPNGRFAKINVGAAKENIIGVSIKHLPKSKNLSHAGIFPPNVKNRRIELELSNMVTSNDIFPAIE